MLSYYFFFFLLTCVFLVFLVLYVHVLFVNRKDCGVFMIKLMESWRADVDSRSLFSYQDVLNLRILYANKLYFYSKNQVDLSLVTEFYALVISFCTPFFSDILFHPFFLFSWAGFGTLQIVYWTICFVCCFFIRRVEYDRCRMQGGTSLWFFERKWFFWSATRTTAIDWSFLFFSFCPLVGSFFILEHSGGKLCVVRKVLRFSWQFCSFSRWCDTNILALHVLFWKLRRIVCTSHYSYYVIHSLFCLFVPFMTIP